MKRKTIFIVLSLVAVVLIFSSVQMTRAQLATPEQEFQQQKYDIEWGGKDGSEPSLTLLDRLLETQSAWKLGEWVQVTIKKFHYPVQPTYLDSVTRVPEESIQKLWFGLDESGLVISSVDQIWDLEGRLLQEAIVLEGQSHHTLTGATFQFNPHELDLNMGVVLEKQQAYDVPGTAQMEESELDGKAVYILSTRDDFGVSVAVGEEKAIGAHSIAWFDQETGLILRSATFVTLENGDVAQLLDYQYDFTLNADKPVEILEKISP